MIKIIMILMLILITSCDSGSSDNSSDNQPTVVNPINDIIIEFGDEITFVDFSSTFSNLEEGDHFDYSVRASNSITEWILENTSLTLSYGLDIGSTEYILRGVTNELSIEDTFTVTINSNTAFTNMTNAITSLNAEQITSATSTFQILSTNSSSHIKDIGSIGLVLTQIAEGKSSDALTYLKSKTITTEKLIIEQNALRSLLNYAESENLESAISLAENLLIKKPTYVSPFDTDIDYKDLQLNIAQSAYHLGNFTKALEYVKYLGAANGLNTPDTDLNITLPPILSELSNTLSN